MKRLTGGESLVPDLEVGEVKNESCARDLEIQKAMAIKNRSAIGSRGEGKALKTVESIDKGLI